ncbi:hypothetical protein B0H12DRAFT_1071171 [Mycena haematopus]|nr:hypothetical protein B0H12DRAFT_1071171 [Mycena haematopus]
MSHRSEHFQLSPSSSSARSQKSKTKKAHRPGGRERARKAEVDREVEVRTKGNGDRTIMRYDIRVGIMAVAAIRNNYSWTVETVEDAPFVHTAAHRRWWNQHARISGNGDGRRLALALLPAIYQQGEGASADGLGFIVAVTTDVFFDAVICVPPSTLPLLTARALWWYWPAQRRPGSDGRTMASWRTVLVHTHRAHCGSRATAPSNIEEIAPFFVSADDLINPLPPSPFYGD